MILSSKFLSRQLNLFFLGSIFVILALLIFIPELSAAPGDTVPCPASSSSKPTPPWHSIIIIIIGAAVVIYSVRSRNIRKKAQKQYQAIFSSLEPGDGIITFGGILATVQEVGEKTLTVSFGSGVSVKIIKESAATIIKLKDHKPELDYFPGIREHFPKPREHFPKPLE
jgi:preprotein translocase YajC subunit